MPRHPTPKIPDWMRVIADDAYLGAADMALIFGIQPKSVAKSMGIGLIPHYDMVHSGNYKWRMKTVRAFIRKGERAAPCKPAAKPQAHFEKQE